MKAYSALNYVNDYLDSEDFENYAQDAYWNRTFNEDFVFSDIISKAISDGLFLEDMDEHTEAIYELIIQAYDNKEKGLS